MYRYSEIQSICNFEYECINKLFMFLLYIYLNKEHGNMRLQKKTFSDYNYRTNFDSKFYKD